MAIEVVVAIMNEMNHSVRVVPTDGRPHLPAGVDQFRGDSIGHWEGQTLVIDTIAVTSAFLPTSVKKASNVATVVGLPGSNCLVSSPKYQTLPCLS